MKLNKGQQLHGFTVTRARHSSELGGDVIEFEHDKTGAQVFWVNTGIDNKLFSIAFMTTPEDDTGVFHIIEHSTLCGSAKYPVREPFVELLKGSMQTFLNAMTAPDWTMYPVSSRNDQDFINLCSVYLDAVFAPRILTNPNIFYQEGWHIEQEDGRLSYKGVVFNEMKGATADVNDVIEQKLRSMLFPDNSYGYDSGGNPKAIPTLTYEKFVDTYRRYYHPTNAHVYLDGDLPIERTLELMDEYFSKYERSSEHYGIAPQTPVASRAAVNYEMDPDEDTHDKGYLSLARIACGWDDYVTCEAVGLLNDLLCETNESPLQKAVLDSGLAKSVELSIESNMMQPYFLVSFKDVKDGAEDELIALTLTTVRRLCEEGLDHLGLTAAINQLEFSTREPDEPQGLRRCMSSITPLLFGGDGLEALENDALFKALREMVDNGGFERKLSELFADPDGFNVLSALPSTTLADEKRAEEQARLDALLAGWTDADLAANAALNATLAEWQQTPDTPEQLATLPALTLDQLGEMPHMYDTEENSCGGVRVMYHPAPCHGITHISMYYNISDLTLDEIMRLKQMTAMLKKLPTANHDLLSLQNEIKLYLGELRFSSSLQSDYRSTTESTLMLNVHCSVLTENIDHAYDLIYEILTATDFTRTDLMRNIIDKADIASRQLGSTSGHMLALSAAMAASSSDYLVNEHQHGSTSLRYLHKLAHEFDDLIEGDAALAQRVLKTAVCRSRLIMSVTGESYIAPERFIARLPEGMAAPKATHYGADAPQRSACAIPAQVGFSAQALNLGSIGVEPDGAYQVAANILSLEYLWNRVRVQGGAYGAGFSTNISGELFTYSYRDPTPMNSLEINKGLGSFLREFADSGVSLDKYIISSVSGTESLLSPQFMAQRVDYDTLKGRTRAVQEEYRRQMIATDAAALRRFADLLDRFAAEGAVSVFASEAQLQGAEDFVRIES